MGQCWIIFLKFFIHRRSWSWLNLSWIFFIRIYRITSRLSCYFSLNHRNGNFYRFKLIIRDITLTIERLIRFVFSFFTVLDVIYSQIWLEKICIISTYIFQSDGNFIWEIFLQKLDRKWFQNCNVGLNIALKETNILLNPNQHEF